MDSRILWNRKFIIVFTRDSAFYCPRRDTSSPCIPTPLFKIYFNVTTHLSLVLSRGLLPLIPPTKFFFVFPFYPIRVSINSHFTFCLLITLLRNESHKSPHYATSSSVLRIFLLLSSKNFLGILLWGTRGLCLCLCLCFSDKLRKQVSKPYKRSKFRFC